MATLGRQLSATSGDAIAHLAGLEAQFKGLESQVNSLQARLGEENVTMAELMSAKASLAQVVGFLDKLLFERVDAVTTSDLGESGKDLVKQQRKVLTARIGDLQERVEKLHGSLGTRIAASAAAKAEAEGAAAAEGEEAGAGGAT